ncbi:MAG: GNAT family N-acetyltransferase [Verrucomicrobia bacterium]|nr:GNAT family N-acetyltransferase [Verrucomicrobiota bacterium]
MTGNDSTFLRLASWAEGALPDLDAVLKELGHGDSRCFGTTFGRGECTLEVFLRQCRDAEDPARIAAEFVPQTSYWIVNEANRVVGIVRVRHRLNERLLRSGGHIGYYVRASERGKGYGKQTLRLALQELRRLGVRRALLTVHSSNTISARLVVANGGLLENQTTDPVSGEALDRYWIDLKKALLRHLYISFAD